MTSDTTVVARYDEASRAAVERTLRRLVRKQGILLLVIGLLFGLMVLVPVVVALTDGFYEVSAVAVLLVVPLAIGALGVRQLRRKPRLPVVAVTITPDAVLFPALDRPSALAPQIRAEEWPRKGTSAELVPASGLQVARVEFTRRDGGKRRRRSIAASNLDVDARVIVDALDSAPNS